jgi:hypothetical protein
MSITQDKEFKLALAGLPIEQQRQVAVAFCRRVLHLSHDVRVKTALESAARADITEAELLLAAHAAHAARVDSFAQCGRDAGWTAQAGHFVAKAAEVCVRIAVPGENIAWEAAMQTRLARTCQTVAEGLGTENKEAREQYRILETFLQS